MEEKEKLEEQAVEEKVAELRKQQEKEMAGEYAKSMAKQELGAAVSRALPDEVNHLRWAGLRGIPVIGSIVQWLDNIKWIRSMFGGK